MPGWAQGLRSEGWAQRDAELLAGAAASDARAEWDVHGEALREWEWEGSQGRVNGPLGPGGRLEQIRVREFTCMRSRHFRALDVIPRP
ncbi:hypothetical protein CHIBA101_0950 [Actinomyces sp. Chiba101]|nr:hypothetical protein CHIBA101_0950 [Actinomyces sp. Chiba101]GAV94213.1 hypothetical protein ADENT20671_0981 [Actinomyces denticolens]